MDLSGLSRWMDAYGEAWITNDAGRVRALFSHDAVYYVSPFKPPWRGRDEIVTRWLSDPQKQRDVTFEHSPLAAEGNTGIVHWNVAYTRTTGAPVRVEMDGILVLKFDGEGKCIEHREWFFTRETPT